jgi:hypothetical protein
MQWTRQSMIRENILVNIFSVMQLINNKCVFFNYFDACTFFIFKCNVYVENIGKNIKI